MRGKLVLSIALFALFISLQTAFGQNKVMFKDVAAKAGVDFKYNFGDDSYVNILESSGSGITIFDYNGDGWMDLYLMNGTYLEGISDKDGIKYQNSSNKLYHNNGDGTFTDVTEKAGVDDRHWSMAAGAIDYDNDGDEDLFLLNYGPNVFYRNNGDGTFTDIANTLGLVGPKKLNGFEKWSIGVAYWDENKDGRLDLMVGNFLAFDPEYISTQTPGMMPHPSEYKGQLSMFYEQQSDGTFIDVTEKKNLAYPDSKCMGLTVFDADDDGDLDILQANDHQFNFLFKKEKGVFREAGVESGIAANNQGKGTGSMDGTLGDIDGDGLVDVLVSDLKYGAFYRNLGNGLYTDIVEESGVAKTFAGKGSWGTALFDFDNDGDLDIVSANGTAEELILQYPLLLENDGKGHFTDRGKEYGDYFKVKRSGRGLAVLDFDNDGDMDVIISHLDKPGNAVLLENEGGNKNNWLGITLKGESGPAAAISAKVTVISGSQKQVFINQWATGYLSNNDPRLHVGLDDASGVDQIIIDWTDGKRETYKDIKANQYLVVKQGEGIIRE
ncbi:CRTAC1 family protein [Sunxiuqinia sp. A32]|uniref:CRTAC1 family protein n=1 Tax=Sunxiuqinia sp. A32 TaxID=3461496 RepID=UPI004045E0AB